MISLRAVMVDMFTWLSSQAPRHPDDVPLLAWDPYDVPSSAWVPDNVPFPACRLVLCRVAWQHFILLTQSLWRRYKARCARWQLSEQQQADWEQLWSREEKAFYYYNKKSGQSMYGMERKERGGASGEPR
jgi:hypothetical protein